MLIESQYHDNYQDEPEELNVETEQIGDQLKGLISKWLVALLIGINHLFPHLWELALTGRNCDLPIYFKSVFF